MTQNRLPIPGQLETQPVAVKTVNKDEVNQIFDYLNSKPYGEVALLMLTLGNLYDAYKNNTEILVRMQPEGKEGLSLDDI